MVDTLTATAPAPPHPDEIPGVRPIPDTTPQPEPEPAAAGASRGSRSGSRAARASVAAALTVGIGLGAGVMGVGVAAATTTHSGDQILITVDDNKLKQGVCTLNSVVAVGGQSYGVTAGHCLDEAELGGVATRITNGSGELLADKADIARGKHQFVTVGQGNSGVSDFAWFPLDDSVDVRNVVTSNPGILPFVNTFLQSPEVPVAGYIDTSELKPGDVVTKDGSMSGRTMGVVLGVNNDTREVQALIPAVGGDSGSPLYVVRDGEAYIVGTLTGGSPLLFNVFDGTQEHVPSVGA